MRREGFPGMIPWSIVLIIIGILLINFGGNPFYRFVGWILAGWCALTLSMGIEASGTQSELKSGLIMLVLGIIVIVVTKGTFWQSIFWWGAVPLAIWGLIFTLRGLIKR